MMAEAATLIRTIEQPAPSEFDRLYAVWKHAKGRWEMESNTPDNYAHGLPDDEDNAHCEATSDALNAFLLHPVSCPKQFLRKMRVFQSEEIYRGWCNDEEIVAQLVRDAHSIAVPDRERSK